MRKLVFVILLLLMFVSSKAQIPMNDWEFVDIEALLDSFAAAQNAKKDTLVVATPTTDTVNVVTKKNVQHKKSVAKDVYKIKKISISKTDSVRLAKEALAEAAYNPMFLDWVFLPDDTILSDESDEGNIIHNLRTEAKRHVAETSLELFSCHADELPDVSELQLRTRKRIASIDEFLFHQQLKTIPQTAIKINRKEKKWSIKGKLSAQFSQSYISKNWYTGGYSNLAILSYATVSANYDNKKNLRFDNTLEWKAGFNSTTNDSLRFLNTNEDVFRISSNLGLKAVKNWFYSLSAEFNTQLFNTYVENTRELSTATFSPIRFYLSLGMEYKYKNIVALNISPLSYKLVYVMNRSKAEGVTQSVADKFNIPEGKSTLHTVGSRLQVNAAYAFSKELKLETKMYLYTDYKNVEFDWEIVGNFIANRFLTVQLSLHPRYDSSLVLAEGQKSRFQFREFVSLGFLYVF